MSGMAARNKPPGLAWAYETVTLVNPSQGQEIGAG